MRLLSKVLRSRQVGSKSLSNKKVISDVNNYSFRLEIVGKSLFAKLKALRAVFTQNCRRSQALFAICPFQICKVTNLKKFDIISLYLGMSV